MAEEFNPFAGLGIEDDQQQNQTEEEFNPFAGLGIEDTTQQAQPEEYNPLVGLVEEPKQETTEPESADIPEALAPPKPKKFERPEDAEQEEQITFAELSADKDYMDMLREYQKSRFGEEGEQLKDESNEDYLKRFLSHTREFEWNSIDMGRQLDWVRNADEESRIKFGYLYSQLDRLPSFYEEGGGDVTTALRDFGKSLVTDPLNYIGFGAGKAAGFVATKAITQALKQGGKKLALEEAAKLSAKRMLGTKAGKIAAGGVVVEAGAAAVQDLKQQEVEMLSEKYGEDTPEEYDLLRTGLVGTIGVGAGALGLKLSGGLQGDKLLRSAREARVKGYQIAKELTAREKQFAAEAAAQRSKEATNSATGIFDQANGRKTLEQLGELAEGADATAQIQFKTELMQRVGRVVTNVVEDMANAGTLGEMVDVDTKASEVIGKIVSDSLKIAQKGKKKTAEDVAEQTRKMLLGEKGVSAGALDQLGEINAEVLESAISRAGITPKQFVDAMGVSYTEAGKYLQTASNVGKIIKAVRSIDPQLEKELTKYTEADKMTGVFGKAHEFMKRMDRERRSLMVTQIATTVRNMASAGTRLTFDVSANLIESSLYQIGRNADAAMSGNLTSDVLKSGWRDVIRDSFGSLNRMRDMNATDELTSALLKHNPSLAQRMDRTLQEVGSDDSVSFITRKLNGLNVAQDMFFRRAIFTDTLDKRLRRAGIIVDNPTKLGQYKSLEEFAQSGKVIPASVLSDAVDESLAFTFSRMPKASSAAKGGRAGDTVGHAFIKMNEALGPVPGPLGTAAFPFGKFMVNALQFQFQYSPTSVVSSAYTYGMAKYTKKLAAASARAGDTGLSEAQQRAADVALAKAREDFSKGIVGTAALMSAIKHRSNNQDLKWYEAKSEEDGSTYDMRPFFPITPYLAVADLIVKMSEDKPIDAKEFLEGFTGAQFRTGASSALLENFFESIRGEKKSDEQLAEAAGEFIGEVFGGFATPLRVVRDVKAAYDTEEAYIRDARQTEGVGGLDRFTSALTNTIQKELPGASQALPKVESPTREAPLVRQSPLIGQLTGVRREAPRNPAEQELTRLGIKQWKIVPTQGDRKADALIKRFMGREVENRLSDLVQTEKYGKKTEAEKRAAVNALLNRYRKRATSLAKIEARKDDSKPYTPFDRAQFNKLTDNQRRLVDEYYKEKYGKDVVDMQEEEPNQNHLKKAIRLGRVLSQSQNR
jgi:hypothetical protein